MCNGGNITQFSLKTNITQFSLKTDITQFSLKTDITQFGPKDKRCQNTLKCFEIIFILPISFSTFQITASAVVAAQWP